MQRDRAGVRGSARVAVQTLAGGRGGEYLRRGLHLESREAMQSYLDSELFSQVANNPAFENVSSREFEVLEGPTRVTRGMD